MPAFAGVTADYASPCERLTLPVIASEPKQSRIFTQPWIAPARRIGRDGRSMRAVILANARTHNHR
jgi:hypothetical protein